MVIRIVRTDGGCRASHSPSVLDFHRLMNCQHAKISSDLTFPTTIFVSFMMLLAPSTPQSSRIFTRGVTHTGPIHSVLRSPKDTSAIPLIFQGWTATLLFHSSFPKFVFVRHAALSNTGRVIFNAALTDLSGSTFIRCVGQGNWQSAILTFCRVLSFLLPSPRAQWATRRLGS